MTVRDEAAPPDPYRPSARRIERERYRRARTRRSFAVAARQHAR